MAINVHTNYYMLEGTPHAWPINMHGTSHVAINVYGNYFMVEGTPHVWPIYVHCKVIHITFTFSPVHKISRII